MSHVFYKQYSVEGCSTVWPRPARSLRAAGVIHHRRRIMGAARGDLPSSSISTQDIAQLNPMYNTIIVYKRRSYHHNNGNHMSQVRFIFDDQSFWIQKLGMWHVLFSKYLEDSEQQIINWSFCKSILNPFEEFFKFVWSIIGMNICGRSCVEVDKPSWMSR